MPDTFTDRLDETSVCLFFWVRIAGIPNLFAAGPVPDFLQDGVTAWGQPYTSINGDIYNWSETLLVDEGWGAVGCQAQPKGGMPQGGNLAFRFRVDDRVDGNMTKPAALWRTLMQFNLRRTDAKVANLAEDLAINDVGNVEMLSNPWQGQSGYVNLFMGKETIIVEDGTDTSTERGPINTRGAYASKAFSHEARTRTEQETHLSGLSVSDMPLSWEGRIVEFFMTVGTWTLCDLPDNMHLGRLATLSREGAGGSGDYPDLEPNTKLMYRGILTNVRQGGDHTSIMLETASLDALIEGPILARTPKAKAGLGPSQGWAADGSQRKIYIDSHNNRFSLTVRSDYINTPLSVVCVDHSQVTDGDTLQFFYPGGSRTFTARTTPVTATEFGIGADAEDLIDNLKDKLESDSANWGVHYGWTETDPQNIPWMLRFVFKSAQGHAADSYALIATCTNAGALIFSQADTTPIALQMLNEPLLYWDGAAHVAVPAGLHDVADVERYMQETITRKMYSLGLIPTLGPDGFSAMQPYVTIQRIQPTDGSWTNKWRLGFSVVGAAPEGTAIDWYTRYNGQESFLRDLGFLQDSYFVEGSSSDVSKLYIDADKNPPAFRWPASAYATPPRLYLHNMGEWDNNNMVEPFAFFDNVGQSLMHGLIDGVDVLRMAEGNFDNGTYIPNNSSGNYVLVTRRNLMGWGNHEEVYVEIENPQAEKEQKEIGFERVLFFERGVSFAKGVLQMLIGGTGDEHTNHATYDVGWKGCGLAIHSDYIDVASFEEHSDYGFEVRYWCIREGDNIRDLLNDECKLCQVQVCAGLGQLYLMTTRPLLEVDEGDAYVLDDTNLVTDLGNQGSGFDTAENRIVNKGVGKGNYNPATKSYGLTDMKAFLADSIADFGEKEPVTFNIRGNPGVRGSTVVAQRVMGRIFGAYGRRYAVIEQYVGTPRAWLLRLGDAVLLTAPELPAEDADGRGVVDLPCRIFGKDDYFMSGGSDKARYFTKLVLISRVLSGQRYSRWCPSAYASGYKGGGGSGVTLICPTKYSRTGYDIDRFAATWKIKLYSLVDGSSVDRTVVSVNGATSEMEVNTSTSIAMPCLILFDSYNDLEVGGPQSKYVMFSDGENVGSANDAPFYYP